jgi:AcrR family transcriptional regulator
LGIAERRTRERSSLRQHILDEATALFVEQGYHAVSMRKLAERIEYSPTTIYLHFRDKAELFNAICEETFRGLKAQLVEIAARGGDPVERLRDGLRTYASFGLAHPQHYIVTFVLGPGEATGAEFRGSVGEQAFQHLRDGVTACVASGAFRPCDVETVAQSLWAAVHGVVSLLIQNCGFPFVDSAVLVDTTIDSLIEGLSASRLT